MKIETGALGLCVYRQKNEPQMHADDERAAEDEAVHVRACLSWAGSSGGAAGAGRKRPNGQI